MTEMGALHEGGRIVTRTASSRHVRPHSTTTARRAGDIMQEICAMGRTARTEGATSPYNATSGAHRGIAATNQLRLCQKQGPVSPERGKKRTDL